MLKFYIIILILICIIYLNNKNKEKFTNNNKLNDYKIIKNIYNGKFSNVYKVKNKNNLFALKKNDNNYILNKNEFDILSKLNHPFISKYIKKFVNKNHTYFLMNYISNLNLDKYLTNFDNMKLSHNDSIFSSACILSALMYLHSKNIIYRDLKPENLMIDKDGYVILIDFQFVKKLKKNEKTYTFLGTPEYMAPEIVTKKGYNWYSDNYALGIFIYELELGYSPFLYPGGDVNQNNIFLNIQNKKIEFPDEISFETKDIVEKLLHKNIKKRLGSSNNTDEISKHNYFSNYNFNNLKNKKYKSPLVKN